MLGVCSVYQPFATKNCEVRRCTNRVIYIHVGYKIYNGVDGEDRGIES